ncbi:hypothetical protein VU04_09130 [Desulfobulbus sp. TB]|nr:hypothetical protein [Desulfobulbus sp. TB]
MQSCKRQGSSWEIAEDIDFYALHDRLILATAKWLEVSVISSDGKFAAVEGIEVVWG